MKNHTGYWTKECTCYPTQLEKSQTHYQTANQSGYTFETPTEHHQNGSSKKHAKINKITRNNPSHPIAMNKVYLDILTHIADNPGQTPTQIAQKLKRNYPQVSRALHRAQQQGWITNNTHITDPGLKTIINNPQHHRHQMSEQYQAIQILKRQKLPKTKKRKTHLIHWTYTTTDIENPNTALLIQTHLDDIPPKTTHLWHNKETSQLGYF